MNQTAKADSTIRNYLLGELTEPEQAALESKYFGDKDKFEEVCAAENDLIDDYLLGNLSTHDRGRFEQAYLSSPERLRKVQFAGSMLRTLYGTDPVATRAQRSASAGTGFPGALARMYGRWNVATTTLLLASLTLILGVAVLLLAFECLRLRRALTTSEEAVATQSQKQEELDRLLAEQRAGSDQLTKDLEALRAQKAEQQNTPPSRPPIQSIASFILKPGLIRGGGEPRTIAIPPGIDVIELRLNLSSLDFKKYTGALSTPEGATLWKQAVEVHPTRTGGTALVRVPAKLVPPGDYILRIDGIGPSTDTSEVADSYFRVTQKTGH